MKVRQTKIWAAWFLAVFVILNSSSGMAQDFTVEAEVDKNEVQFGESLTLVLTISQDMRGISGSRIGAPQLSEIPGFDIVSQRSSQNMTMINGVGQIQVQTVLELVPKGPGEITIPSLTVKGGAGKSVATKPIKVKVLPPNQTAEKAAEPEGTAATESEEPQDRGGISFGKGLMIVFLVIGLIIASPILLSMLLNRDRKPSTRWKEEKSHVQEVETVAATPVQNGRNRKEPPQKPIPVVEPKQEEKIDFEREVNALKRLHPDVGPEFYRAYFDLFHRALLAGNRRVESVMTPDEMFLRLAKILPPDSSICLSRIGSDWEMIVYANTKPGRSFAAIHGDAVNILQSIQLQESRL